MMTQACPCDTYPEQGSNYYQSAFLQCGRREGKWTSEEENYANALIEDFKDGMLALTDGTSLRTYLAKMLNCSTMRVSKKFVGKASVGKKFFRKRMVTSEDIESKHELDERRANLGNLEHKFHSSVVGQTMRKGYSSPPMYYGAPQYYSPYAPPMHSTPMMGPAVDASCPGCINGDCNRPPMYGYGMSAPSPYMMPHGPSPVYHQSMLGQKRPAPFALPPTSYSYPSPAAGYGYGAPPPLKRMKSETSSVGSAPHSPYGVEERVVSSPSLSGSSGPEAEVRAFPTSPLVNEAEATPPHLDGDLFDMFSLDHSGSAGAMSLPLVRSEGADRQPSHVGGGGVSASPVHQSEDHVVPDGTVTFKFLSQQESVVAVGSNEGSGSELPLVKSVATPAAEFDDLYDMFYDEGNVVDLGTSH